MHRPLIGSLVLLFVLMGCGPGGNAGPTAAGPGVTAPAGNAAGSFCDASARLEMADASNRQAIQAGLEADTPAEMVEDVAVIREFMERQASGDDPYKDPDFLFEYDNAVKDTWDYCGLR